MNPQEKFAIVTLAICAAVLGLAILPSANTPELVVGTSIGVVASVALAVYIYRTRP